ncbi:MAG: PIN/TRAM domain-containing protein [Planctomycetaceae bacterium]|jgi:uncharacterized protein YacL
MLLFVIRILYAMVCVGTIASFVTVEGLPEPFATHRVTSFILLLLASQIVTFLDILIPQKRIDVVSAIYFGLLIGFMLSWLTNLALSPVILGNFRPVTLMLTNLILPYLCVTLLLQTRDKFRFIIPYIEFARDVRGGRPYVLDTSALIDGRIADVLETRIIDAPIVIPSFVLKELQDIADSGDKLRRNRGRRGLDVVSRLQSNTNIELRIHEVKEGPKEGETVDQRLVDLTRELRGAVVTNDFNLNKVASVLGVDVINLNDLANCLKPKHLPGERIVLKLVKPGETSGQGVGYLDDGTMVVCEDGGSMVGKEAEIVVKSVRQSSAGRMIFGRLPEPSDR